jgi:hypothetical protein
MLPVAPKERNFSRFVRRHIDKPNGEVLGETFGLADEHAEALLAVFAGDFKVVAQAASFRPHLLARRSDDGLRAVNQGVQLFLRPIPHSFIPTILVVTSPTMRLP